MRAFHTPDGVLGMDRMVYLQQGRRIYRAIHHGHSMCGIMCDCSYSIYQGINWMISCINFNMVNFL